MESLLSSCSTPHSLPPRHAEFRSRLIRNALLMCFMGLMTSGALFADSYTYSFSGVSFDGQDQSFSFTVPALLSNDSISDIYASSMTTCNTGDSSAPYCDYASFDSFSQSIGSSNDILLQLNFCADASCMGGQAAYGYLFAYGAFNAPGTYNTDNSPAAAGYTGGTTATLTITENSVPSVPEPNSALLFGTGLLGAGGIVWRRIRKEYSSAAI